MTSHAGPVDPSVLYQQELHISSAISSGNLDNVLRVRRTDNLIWKLYADDIHHRVRSCLHLMGFYNILRCGFYKCDNHLITALVERWRRETHTFHFRVGEATVTLQDVELIWGLNVDGLPVTGTDIAYKTSEWEQYCYDWLGFIPQGTQLKGGKLLMTALDDHCRGIVIDDDSSDLIVSQYSRCVALMIIGGCMLPDSEGCAVKLMYLHLLHDISRVHKYSWGSAVLAYLYRELCSASQIGKGEIAGPLFILQVWAWSRITPLCPDPLGYRRDNDEQANEILPYGKRWNRVFTWTHTPTHSLRIIRDVLDRMEADQFKWVLYDKELKKDIWRSVCPLICFNIVEMYRPNRVLRQFGMSQDIPAAALDGDDLHEWSRRGRRNFDWVAFHRQSIDAWDDRTNLIVEGEVIEENLGMSHDYERWYDRITRRFISPVESQVDYGYRPGDAQFRCFVREKALELTNLFNGLSLRDQPREVLVEAIKKAIQISGTLCEMANRTPNQNRSQGQRQNERSESRSNTLHSEQASG